MTPPRARVPPPRPRRHTPGRPGAGHGGRGRRHVRRRLGRVWRGGGGHRRGQGPACGRGSGTGGAGWSAGPAGRELPGRGRGGGRAGGAQGQADFPVPPPPVPPPSDGPRAPAHLEHPRRWSARRWPCRPRTFAASPGPRWPWRRRDGPRSLPPGPRTVAGPAPRRCPRPAPRVRSPVGGAGRGGQCGREAIPGPGPMTRGGIPTARESATSVPPGHVVSVQQTRRSNGQPVPAVQGLLSPTCSQALQVRYRRPLPCRAPPSICSCRPACLF